MTVRGLAFMQSAYRNLQVNNSQSAQALRNLSSGYRINTAADDSAGLAVSEKMRGQVGGLGQAYTNAMQGISMVQTAEGTMDSTHSILQRMRTLAVGATNGTMTNEDRAQSNLEFGRLKEELDRIAGSAHFNGIKLMDGSLGGATGTKAMNGMGFDSVSVDGSRGVTGAAGFTIARGEGDTMSVTMQIGGQTVVNTVGMSDKDTTFSLRDGTEVRVNFTSTAADLREGMVNNVQVRSGSAFTNTTNAISSDSGSRLTFQVGANGAEDQRIAMGIGNMSTVGLGIHGLDIASLDGANAAIAAIDRAVAYTSGQRSNLGATQNRLEHTINNLATTKNNLLEAESVIRDADMAYEIMRFTQSSILSQASQAMLSQGMNLSQSTMLSLLMR